MEPAKHILLLLLLINAYVAEAIWIVIHIWQWLHEPSTKYEPYHGSCTYINVGREVGTSKIASLQSPPL